MRHSQLHGPSEFIGSDICAYPKQPCMSPTTKNAWWELLRLHSFGYIDHLFFHRATKVLLCIFRWINFGWISKKRIISRIYAPPEFQQTSFPFLDQTNSAAPNYFGAYFILFQVWNHQTFAGNPSLLDFLLRCLYNHPISTPEISKNLKPRSCTWTSCGEWWKNPGEVRLSNPKNFLSWDWEPSEILGQNIKE